MNSPKCGYCGKPIVHTRRKYCSDYHASAFRKTKRRRALIERVGFKCQECGSTEGRLFVYLTDQTVLCGRHHVENCLKKFNKRFPSKNPAKLASILGKESKIMRKWEK